MDPEELIYALTIQKNVGFCDMQYPPFLDLCTNFLETLYSRITLYG